MTVSKSSPSLFFITGLVRNCSGTLREDVLRLLRSVGPMGRVVWYLVESDSEDGSVDVLRRLKREIPGFDFVSLGNLRGEIPNRTARLAYCRNHAIATFETRDAYADVDYYIVSDFDGINATIDFAAFSSCWAGNVEWDMCCANQDGPYYDVFALRHPVWSPIDCWEQARFLRQYHSDRLWVDDAAVYSKMIKIPRFAEWIMVDSAFGGLAVYHAATVRGHRYCGGATKGDELCEHVAFHQSMREAGSKLFINPGLINARYTQHTEHLRPLKRLASRVRNRSRTIRRRLGITPKSERHK